MNLIDPIVQEWLNSLQRHLALPAPTLPTNAAGESWPDAIRAIGQRFNNTPQQVQQQIDRAQALVARGTSPAMAIQTVRATLERWSHHRSDDATFQARRDVLARNVRLWVQPA